MPTSPILAGFGQIVELASVPTYDRRTGWSAIRRFRGPREQIAQFLASLAGEIVWGRVHANADGPFTMLEVQYDNAQDGSDDPTDPLNPTWDRIVNDLNKDLFTHPKFIALSQEVQELLRKVRQDPVNAPRDQIPPTGDAAEFLNLILQKVEGYIIPQYVVRVTSVLTTRSAYTELLTNVDLVYSSAAQFRAAEGVPNNLPFAIPAGEWLVKKPTVTAQKNGRWQRVQEFWHADIWSETLYTHV